MSFTCQQCGTTATQALNFCRHCGAPAPTIALATSPLTRQLAEADPLDTWEPAKHVAAPAATEVLPGAAVAAPQPLPASAELPASINPVATAPSAMQRGWLAAIVAGLLMIAGGGGYFFIHRANASAVVPIAVAAPPVAESAVAAAAPLPTPTVDQPVVIPANLPTPRTTAANAKPAASVKAEGQANSAALPTPSVYAATKSAAPEPAPDRAEAPDRNLALIEQGNRLAGAGQLQDAIQAYEKARHANPGNTDVYYLLGSAYQRSGALAKALEAYRQCTSGNYAAVAANHVKNLEKKLSRTTKGQAPAPE
ncbi:MAG: tetratricopeptide repeat protein [Acidobacteria bacterium]|nr:tetratricopeptide repeat protein [Acidobacteriota bacterium]MBI3421768.1 tetratricopeptide repeat protein [Acidobacteriota bacterium]